MSDHEMSDRRPLKTRSWPLFQKLASWMAKRRISPNMISVSSVFLATIGAAGLLATKFVDDDWHFRVSWIVAVLGIQGRLIANLLDGMVAVEGGLGSPVGPLYNEVPDRISDPILMVAAGYAFSGDPVVGWFAAVASLFVAYVRAIGASVGAGQLFAGPMAKPQRMAILTTISSMGIFIPRDWMTIGDIGVMQVGLWLIVIGCALTSIRRLKMAASLLRSI